MLITRKLVLQRQARLLVNVYWIAMMITPVKLLVFPLLKITTPNVLVRFRHFNMSNIFKLFIGKLSIRVSM